MGAYMSEPLTNKESEDGTGNGFRFGASKMQGWRAAQEDAHHCIAEFDEKSSLFGVYDGHGGAEVAIYVAKNFPELLKRTSAYMDGNLEKAFIQAYLEMDASIKEPSVLAEIQKLAKAHLRGDDSKDATADFEEENVSELYEEATMPLDKLVAKYQTGTAVPDEDGATEEKPCSSKALVGSSSSPQKATGSAGSSSSVASPSVKESPVKSSGNEGSSSSSSLKKEDEDGVKSEAQESSVNGEIKLEETPSKNGISTIIVTEKKEEQEPLPVNGSSENSSNCNGGNKKEGKEVDAPTSAAPDTSSTEVSPSKPRKGKVHPVPIVLTKPIQREIRKRLAGIQQAFARDSDSDTDSSDSDVNLNADDSSDDSGDNDDGDSSSEDGDFDGNSGSDDDDDENEDDSFLSDMQEPGFDSGTTAVVSLLRWEGDKLHIWVANAGDSRCVVSQNGEAVDMSYDHKPESEEETLRIVKAGGKVTDDGRVNGGLNLSRALGDHSYKQNEALLPEEQMISAMPSIKHLELDPANADFIVIACDGVWNSLTSQQVVEFVKPRLASATPLSKICEELFDECLAPDTCGDGTGCDNMTAIIIQLSKPNLKRSIEETEQDCVEDKESIKRPKIDEEAEAQEASV